MVTRTAVVSLLVSLVVVLGYHVLVGAPTEGRTGETAEASLAALEARMRLLETAAAPTPTATPDAARLPQVEERLVRLESRFDALQEGLRRQLETRAGDPTAPEAVPPVIREARERAARERRAQDVAQYREQIRRVDTEGRVSENDREEAAALLADHAQAVRDLFEGKENAPPEERESLGQRYEAMQAETERALGRWLPAELAARLTGRMTSTNADGR